MDQLLEIMRQLRDPDDGCPWDVEQDFASIAPYTIEEAYEVVDAIEREDYAELRDELGDLLLQVVFHAQMATEAGLFDFNDVARGISDKLVRRHPHVFADANIETAEDQSNAWEASKAEERQAKGVTSLMEGVPRGLPEMQRARKLQNRAAEVGFDWPSAEPVLNKLTEELAEVHEAMDSGSRDRVEDELGDLLFAAMNLARKLQIDPGKSLRRANAKFERRFREIEQAAGGTGALASMDLDEMEALWVDVKKTEGNQA